MIEAPHELDLIHQGLLALVLGVSCLLRKGLDSELLLVFQSDSQVNAREIPLPDLFDWLEQFVEASLVETARHRVPPELESRHLITKQVADLLPVLELEPLHGS